MRPWGFQPTSASVFLASGHAWCASNRKAGCKPCPKPLKGGHTNAIVVSYVHLHRSCDAGSRKSLCASQVQSQCRASCSLRLYRPHPHEGGMGPGSQAYHPCTSHPNPSATSTSSGQFTCMCMHCLESTECYPFLVICCIFMGTAPMVPGPDWLHFGRPWGRDLRALWPLPELSKGFMRDLIPPLVAFAKEASASKQKPESVAATLTLSTAIIQNLSPEGQVLLILRQI